MISKDSAPEQYIKKLIGKKIVAAGYAGDMREFAFAQPGSGAASELVEWHLHIQCPWRLESAGNFVTGYLDWFAAAEPTEETGDEWDPARGGSLQELKLRMTFKDNPPSGRCLYNRTNDFEVTDVSNTVFGDLCIVMTGPFTLRLFPSGSRGEDWRVFTKGDLGSHVIYGGGY